MAQEAELILSFYKTPCQLRLTLWAGTRDLAVPCPQRVYCIYPILPPRHRRSAIPQRATEPGREPHLVLGSKYICSVLYH